MSRKSKIDLELKINLVKQAAHHHLSITEAAREVNVHRETFRQWLPTCCQEGIEGLYPTTRNRVYVPELKLTAVRDYLAEMIANFICEKYGIHSSYQLHDWIKMYTTHGEFSCRIFSGGRSTMTKSRKVSQEEKLNLVWLTDVSAFKWVENGETHKVYLSAIPDLYDKP